MVVARLGFDPIEEFIVELVGETPNWELMTLVILVFVGRFTPSGISGKGLGLGTSGEALLVFVAVEVSTRVSPSLGLAKL